MSFAFRLTVMSILAAASLAAAAPVLAAPAAWVVDKASSRLGFKSAFAGAPFDGEFRRWDAQIAFDPAALDASKAEVSVDMGSGTAGEDSRDDAMPTADWFDVAHFPKATFTTRSIKSLGGDRYQASGDLTIRGVSKPIELPFTLAITGDQAKMDGEVTINRTTFGVGQGEYTSPDSVPFDVTIVVSLSAHRAP